LRELDLAMRSRMSCAGVRHSPAIDQFRIIASTDEMMNGIESHQTDHDEVDGDHEIQKARHDENQDSRDQRNNRSNVGVGEVHQ
jgi:hypothetical protein